MDLQKCIQTLHKHLNHPTEQVAIKTGYSWTRVWRIEHSKAGDGLYVHLEQRDYTGLFLPFKLMALDKKTITGTTADNKAFSLRVVPPSFLYNKEQIARRKKLPIPVRFRRPDGVEFEAEINQNQINVLKKMIKHRESIDGPKSASDLAIIFNGGKNPYDIEKEASVLSKSLVALSENIAILKSTKLQGKKGRTFDAYELVSQPLFRKTKPIPVTPISRATPYIDREGKIILSEEGLNLVLTLRKNPQKEFTNQDLANLTGIDPSSVNYELRKINQFNAKLAVPGRMVPGPKPGTMLQTWRAR